MSDIGTTLALMLLVVFSGAVIIFFAFVMYLAFRMEDPSLSPFKAITLIALVFVLAFAVLNTKSCQAFFNRAGEAVRRKKGTNSGEPRF